MQDHYRVAAGINFHPAFTLVAIKTRNLPFTLARFNQDAEHPAALSAQRPAECSAQNVYEFKTSGGTARFQNQPEAPLNQSRL